jgi:hypothetical protein
MTTPVFLLSQPRAGSTLVQRILATYPDIATAAEPWFLLPLMFPLRDRVPGERNWHPAVRQAMDDFAGQLPGGYATIETAFGDAARRLYDEAAGGRRYFLDKTPPYALIVDELVRVFPEAKLVFLFRNPLSVVASVVETFADGRWRPSDFPSSLFHELAGIIDGYERYGDRACAVRYEELVMGYRPACERMTGHLDLEFRPESLEEFAEVRLEGAMGDPTGVHEYPELHGPAADKWRTILGTNTRRAWCRRYLTWIGRERLELMGYDIHELLGQVNGLPPATHSATDLADTASSVARAVLRRPLSGDTSAWRVLFA